MGYMIEIKWSNGETQRKWFGDVLLANEWFKNELKVKAKLGITGKIVFQGELE